MSSITPRKRRRPLLSCVECRRRKVRCDRDEPCARCVQNGVRCLYKADAGDIASPFIKNRGSQVGASAQLDGHTPVWQESRYERSVTASQAQETHVLQQPENHHHTRDPVSSGLAGPGNSRNGQVRGILSKSRLLGPTHPVTTYRQCDKIYPAGVTENVVGSKASIDSALLSETQMLIASSKTLARAIKRSQMSRTFDADDVLQILPARDVVDALVEHYLRVVEGPFRILHIPAFRKKYSSFWDNPNNHEPLSTVHILLVASIGVRFHHDNETELLSRGRQCIGKAQSYLSELAQKDLVSVAGLQAQCLLSVALQYSPIKPQAAWLTQGNLLRTAVYMGLHRDGERFPNMSFFNAEMRRRLWYTVLELELQAAMDIGMVPMVSHEDFDTKYPLNIDDNDFDATTNQPEPRVAQVWTQASLQILLSRSLETRLRVARLMNNSFTEPRYEDVLHLTKTLTASISALNKDLATHGLHTSSLHQNLANCLTRRFILALHQPFAAKAHHDPRFHYSRKVCLDHAFLILSPTPSFDFDRMLLNTVSLFRHIMHFAAMLVCVELIAQIKEDQPETQLLSLHQTDRKGLLSVVQPVFWITEARLRSGGETNVKSHVFSKIAIAQIQAMEQGWNVQEHVLAKAKRGASKALELLQQQYALCCGSDGGVNMSLSVGDGVPSRGMDEIMDQKPYDDVGVEFDLGDTANWLFAALADI